MKKPVDKTMLFAKSVVRVIRITVLVGVIAWVAVVSNPKEIPPYHPDYLCFDTCPTPNTDSLSTYPHMDRSTP